MSEHSKLPWFVSHHTDNGDVVVRGPDKDGGIWDPIITNCTINNANASPETIKANAEYIVRACNAHEKLLAACMVFITCPETRQLLLDNDPMALRQAEAAIETTKATTYLFGDAP